MRRCEVDYAGRFVAAVRDSAGRGGRVRALAPYESLPTSLGPVFVLPPDARVDRPARTRSAPMLAAATKAERAHRSG